MMRGDQQVVLEQDVADTDSSHSLSTATSLQSQFGKGPVETLVWSVVFLAVLLGCMSRFTDLDARPFWRDEGLTAIWISKSTPSDFLGRFVSADEIVQSIKAPPESSVITVIGRLANKNAEQLPLYYILARIWSDLLGTASTTLRSLSAVFSVLAFPAMYFLGRKIFDSRLAGGIACALMAVSRVHLSYAQQARPYAFWVFTIIVACIALVQAFQRPSVKRWIVYSVLASVMLYAHCLSIAVFAGHATVALLRKNVRSLYAFLGAGSLAFLSVAPWYVNMLNGNMSPNTAWLGVRDNSLTHHLILTANTISLSVYGSHAQADWVVAICSGLLIAAAITLLQFRSKALMPLGLFVLPTLFVLAQDLVNSRDMAHYERYLTPVFIAVPLILSGAIAAGLNHKKELWQWVSLCAMVSVVYLGFLSCASYEKYSSLLTHSKGSAPMARYQKQSSPLTIKELPPIARIVSGSKTPVVITNLAHESVVCLCYLLPKATRVMMVKELPLPSSVLLPDFYFVRKGTSTIQMQCEHYVNGAVYPISPLD